MKSPFRLALGEVLSADAPVASLAGTSAGMAHEQGAMQGVPPLAAGSVRARIEQRMAFASGCEMHLSQIKVRQRGARHFIRRQDFDAAQKELTVLIEAASALKQHLTQWWGNSEAERGPNIQG